MKIGFIGLGKMGRAMVWHLLSEGVSVIVYNRTKEKIDNLLEEYKSESVKRSGLGELIPAYDYKTFFVEQEGERIIFIMVEHGKAVDEVIDNLIISGCRKGDIVIDGGNSFYKDGIKRYKKLRELGINFLDVGTSGGLEGAREGACLMVGGDREVFEKVKPVFEVMAGEKGIVTYFGETGAGHFVKMVHNGVEYGMLEAIGEGFELLSKSLYRINLAEAAKTWSRGSVVRGWLMDLLERALSKDSQLSGVKGSVGGGSTGEWAVSAAKELKVEVPVIEKSLEERKKSRRQPTFAGKIIAVLRREFGGHETESIESP